MAKNIKQRVKDQTCPECKKAGFTVQGLIGHLRMVHGIKVPNRKEVAINSALAAANLAQNVQKAPENVQTIQQNNSQGEEKEAMKQENETKPAENQHDPATCPECQAHTSRIAVLGQEHAAEIEDLTYRLKLAQDTIANLQAEVETKEDTEEETVPVPEVADFIKHCEDGTCEYHAKAWNEVKERIVKAAIENIDPTMIPDNVIESEGLRRNFIPKRITIPMR